MSKPSEPGSKAGKNRKFDIPVSLADDGPGVSSSIGSGIVSGSSRLPNGLTFCQGDMPLSQTQIDALEAPETQIIIQTTIIIPTNLVAKPTKDLRNIKVRQQGAKHALHQGYRKVTPFVMTSSIL